MARFKDSLAQAVKAVRVLDTLKDGDKVLISEICGRCRSLLSSVWVRFWASTVKSPPDAASGSGPGAAAGSSGAAGRILWRCGGGAYRRTRAEVPEAHGDIPHAVGLGGPWPGDWA